MTSATVLSGNFSRVDQAQALPDLGSVQNWKGRTVVQIKERFNRVDSARWSEIKQVLGEATVAVMVSGLDSAGLVEKIASELRCSYPTSGSPREVAQCIEVYATGQKKQGVEVLLAVADAGRIDSDQGDALLSLAQAGAVKLILYCDVSCDEAVGKALDAELESRKDELCLVRINIDGGAPERSEEPKNAKLTNRLPLIVGIGGGAIAVALAIVAVVKWNVGEPQPQLLPSTKQQVIKRVEEPGALASEKVAVAPSRSTSEVDSPILPKLASEALVLEPNGSENAPPVPEILVTAVARYTIQLASFRSRSRAEKLLELFPMEPQLRLVEGGDDDGNYFHVEFGYFTQFSEATSALAALPGSLTRDGAFIKSVGSKS